MDASQDERWLAEASVPGDDTDGAALFCNAFKDYSFSSLPPEGEGAKAACTLGPFVDVLQLLLGPGNGTLG